MTLVLLLLLFQDHTAVRSPPTFTCATRPPTACSIHSFNETIYPAAALDKMECLTSDLDMFPLKMKIPFPQNMQPYIHLDMKMQDSVSVIFNDGS